MRRRYVPLLAGVIALLGVLALVTALPASSAATPVRIMPLGDSITAGPGCWRAMLWNRLQTTGYTNIDFVGGVSDGGGCNPGYSYDFDHEGHGGYAATGIADNNQLPPWLVAARPDIVIMHLGTNDMWGGFIPTATKLTAFTKLVGQMRANNPNIKIIVAQIIPMSQAACATCPADVVALNSAIPGWASGLSTAQSPIVVADLWTGFDAVADTVDGVHPNNGGFLKMANAWYPRLTQVLNGLPSTPTTTRPPVSSTPTRTPTVTTRPPTTMTTRPPTMTTRPPTTTTRPPTTVTTPPTTVTSAPPSTGACRVTYSITSSWQSGFQSAVRITNTGSAAVNGWTLKWTFANGQVISQLWNGSPTQAGAAVSVTDAGYNGPLAANGGTADVGFLASWNNATNAVPTAFTLNNTVCAVA